jgi:hypothetical protein
MLGTALNVMALNTWQFWGTAAVPAGTPGVHGAKGTTTTCSAQGFLNQLGYVVPSYYCALSLYSFVAIRNNFDLGKYIWIERWIHIGVYVYPVASGIYLLIIEAFNYSGHTCWVASVPLGCGNDSGVVCTRGPQNLGDILWLFLGAPAFVGLLVPTFMMVYIYVEVRRKPFKYWIKARTVAKQTKWYLLALYWTYFFGWINGGVLFAKGKAYFSLTLMAICVEIMIGFWIMLVYDHLRNISVDKFTPTEMRDRSSHMEPEGHADGSRRMVLYSIFEAGDAGVEAGDAGDEDSTVAPRVDCEAPTSCAEQKDAVETR